MPNPLQADISQQVVVAFPILRHYPTYPIVRILSPLLVSVRLARLATESLPLHVLALFVSVFLSMFSSADAALRDIAEAVMAAAEAADPATAHIAPTWCKSDPKATIDDKHAGRILELKDGTFRLVGHPRASRMHHGAPAMIVSAGQKTAKTELKDSDWMDSDIKRYSPPIVGAQGLRLGLVAASVSMQPEAEGSDFASITIAALGIRAFSKPIEDGIDMLSYSTGDKLAWSDWTPQTVIPSAAPAPPAAAIAADRLGAADTPLRLLLAALGVAQTGDAFDASLLASWLSVMARSPDRAPAIRLALVGPAEAADTLLARVAKRVADLAAINQDALAAAAEDALDAWRQLPAGVPSQQEVVVADAFCRQLAVRIPPAAPPPESPDHDASDSDGDDALASVPFAAHGSPGTLAQALAYIARLEAQQRQTPPSARAFPSALSGGSPAAGNTEHAPSPRRLLGLGTHGATLTPPPAGRFSSHAAASALRGGAFSPAPTTTAPPDPKLAPGMAELIAVLFPPAGRSMPIEAALAHAALPQPDATQLRKMVAEANGNRPLLDGILGAGSAASARSFLADILKIEAALGYTWARPLPAADWPDTLEFVAALILARHELHSLSPAPPVLQPTADAAAMTSTPGTTLAPDAHSFPGLGYPPGLRASYPPEAASRVPSATDAALGLSYGVLAPLTSTALIRTEHRRSVDIATGAVTPTISAEAEALRLCTAHGQAAVAHHISSGRCSREIAGESIARPQHDSREATHEATLQRTRALVGKGRIDRVSSAVASLASTTSVLRGFCYEAIVVLLGGEDVECARGVRPARLGSDTDCEWGDVANRVHVTKAFRALGSLLAASVCSFASLYTGPSGDCGFGALASDAFRQLGFFGCAKFMRLVLADLAREATTLCTDPSSLPLDITGLLAAWCAGTLPIMRNESQLSEFLDQRLGAAADSQAARAKAQLAATAAAATAAAEFLPASALIGAATNMLKECERIQGAALIAAKATPSRVYTPVAAPGTATTAALGAPPPAGSVPVVGATTQPTGGKRLADPNSKSSQRKALKATAAAARAAGTVSPGRPLPTLQPPATAAPQQTPQQLAAALQLQLAGAAAPAPAPTLPAVAPPPTAPPPGALSPASAPPGSLSLADIQAAIAPLGPLKHRGDCCRAVDAVYKAAFPPGTQWQCPGIFLFGACLSSTIPNSAPCRRCARAPSGPAAALPPVGTKTAIRSACTDAAIVAAVLQGG